MLAQAEHRNSEKFGLICANSDYQIDFEKSLGYSSFKIGSSLE